MPWWQRAWLAAGGALLAAALVYPLAATTVRVADRFVPLPPTLDGMAFMQSAQFRDPYHSSEQIIQGPADYAALRWLQEHVKGSPVILETHSEAYRWAPRVSIYTGLPTVLGWPWHQTQQRQPYRDMMLLPRQRDVATMFNDARPDAALALLKKYSVRYIYVGDLERAYYRPEGLAKFERMAGSGLAIVYQRDGVTIYEVVRS